MRKEVKKVIETGDVERIFEYTQRHNDNLSKEEITALEDAVIQKDKTGEWSYRFAVNVEGADIERLQEAVIQKDTTGCWIHVFAKDIENADIHAIHNKDWIRRL